MARRRRRGWGRIVKWKGRWCARWNDETGRLRQKSFRGSKELAQRFLARKQIEMAEREAGGDQPLVRIKFKDLLDQFEAMFKGHKAPATIDREASYLRGRAEPYFGKKWMDEITRADVERWLMARVNNDGISGATRSRLLSMLSTFFKQAVSLGHCRSNPAAGIRRHKEELKPVPFLDVAAQTRVIEETEGPLRMLVTILLDTGLRLGEALRLRWTDIDFDRQIVAVRKSKNGMPREVPFTGRGQTALVTARNQVPEKAPEPGDPVFPELVSTDPNGEPKLKSQHRRKWKEVRARAGFPDLTLHGLRHVYAVTAVRAGVQLGEVRELLGHKSLIMTMRYARHCPSNASELAREKLEGYLVKSNRRATATAKPHGR